MSGPPRLSVQTQPGPSSSATPRRPQGARRRGVVPGLFIANPDNSDEEAGSPGSASGHGLQRASPVRGSPVSSSSGGRVPSNASVPIPSASGPGSVGSTGSPRSALPPIPSIPAPQSSPLPYTPVVPSVPTPQPPPLPPTPGTATSTPIPSSAPPMPPPQPERHIRRAQTTPMPDQPRPLHEPRPSLGSSSFPAMPASPTRALPPLPSPPSSSSALASNQHPPTPSSAHSMEFGGMARIGSPDSGISPVTTINSARSFGSGDIGRARSGSIQSSKVRVQVTTDNESFTTVDITGMQTPEAIKERVFSKVCTAWKIWTYDADPSYAFVTTSTRIYRYSALMSTSSLTQRLSAQTNYCTCARRLVMPKRP